MTTIEKHSCTCPLCQGDSDIHFPYSIAVRFRNGSRPYSFGCQDGTIKKGSHVVIETAQGLELAEVETDAIDTSRYKLRMPQKEILRIASEKDMAMNARNIELEKEALEVCKEGIAQFQLEMNLLSVQYNLDQTKVLFVYAADQRVDFRELLRFLGSKLHCRIELRQIGDRDKAKMIGAIGICGRETCCSSFKDKFDVISINMAKNQNLALNIEKLSGMCGKLMCCLKYEDEAYKMACQSLPKIGSHIQIEGQEYRLSSINVLREEVRLDNRESTIYVSFAELRGEEKPILEPKAPVVSKETVKKETVKKEVSKPKKKKDSGLPKMKPQKEVPQKKVTTRSFGKKKVAE
ncbi:MULTISPECIES: regulatory iron-sulfur-containing complex subunit RicT [Terrabacteria group]|uniref:regulatory iron-sulfur-containing complex subunit RicT n=1 Tax=Bacillati TaxID=1783272 RepID=UPI001C6E2BFC|nr:MULTISPECIES: regulatory iron-sulfur-containing complex subunit RicT [Terrabacteria group]MBW9212526.1 stage 0 sporulation protein [Trueperella sp. zg.1013]